MVKRSERTARKIGGGCVADVEKKVDEDKQEKVFSVFGGREMRIDRKSGVI